MKITNDYLMQFQEFFMDTLYSHDDVETIQKKLKDYQADPAIKNWIATLTPHMLEVAARMTQHWGKKLK